MLAVGGTNFKGAGCELAHPVRMVVAKTIAAQPSINFFENIIFNSPLFRWSSFNLVLSGSFVNLIHY
jgi:hypothetical protein